MASLVPATAKAIFETALGDHFDTFKATITVNKEAQKTVTLAASQNIYAGYSAPKETVTFTPVSKVIVPTSTIRKTNHWITKTN